METLHREVCLVGGITVAEEFVRAVLYDVTMGKRLEVIVEEMTVISRLHVEREKTLLWCILHHHVDRASHSVALHIGSERLGHFKSVEQF